MKNFLLRANPFAIKAWFDFSCTLTFAVPVEEIAARLPRGLEPDRYDETFGFLAVAFVQTRRLRPAGFPECTGSDFVLAGYRSFVRCKPASGRSLRGLFIHRSETDKFRMAKLGNLFTKYQYVHTGLRIECTENILTARDPETGLEVAADLTTDPPPPLPESSPFPDWKTARRFCGPMPFTFSIEPKTRNVRIVEGRRTNWTPQPVTVLRHHIPWLESAGYPQTRLANAFVVRDVPYFWQRGREEKLP